VRATQSDLEAQLELARQITDVMAVTYSDYNKLAALRDPVVERLKALSANPQAKDATDAMQALAKEPTEIAEGSGASACLGSVNRDMARLLVMVESGDVRPAETASSAAAESCESLRKTLARLKKVNEETLPALNKLLAKYNLAPLPAPDVATDVRCGN